MKKAVLLFGAGASVEYGAPSTGNVTSAIQNAVAADPWLQKVGGDVALQTITTGLQGYLNTGAPNFEQIYHCAHELRSLFEPHNGAVDEFRPLLIPFVNFRSSFTRDALNALCEKIIEILYNDFSSASESPTSPIDTLREFLEKLKSTYLTKIYTTNYDDLLLQASPDIYIGFTPNGGAPAPFELDNYWSNDTHGLFYLHGSVHLGYARPPRGEIGELFWYGDYTTARNNSSFSGSQLSRMDGSSFMRTPIVTGLEKLSRLQQKPFSHYYASMARDLMTADLIFVVGSGLTDFHINSWISQARSRSPKPPLLYVDYWRNGFEEETFFERDSKTIHLFHDLQVHITESMRGQRSGSGWTISEDGSAAVWEKGFKAFLDAPGELQNVIAALSP